MHHLRDDLEAVEERSRRLALVALGVVGIGNALLDVSGLTLLQRGTSNAGRGAVFAVLEVMAENGLTRGEDGLQVYVMCEIPSNVILADEFADIFDGFSIGSNDLTQLILGVDQLVKRSARLLEPAGDAEVARARTALELARNKPQDNELAALRDAATPDNPAGQLAYAEAAFAAGDRDGAAEVLLGMIAADREWNDGAAKTQLFTIFDALKPQDPIVLAGRRRLSSLIFA